MKIEHDFWTHILNKLCEFELNTLVTFSFQIFLVFHVSHGDEKHQLLYIFIGILYIDLLVSWRFQHCNNVNI